ATSKMSSRKAALPPTTKINLKATRWPRIGPITPMAASCPARKPRNLVSSMKLEISEPPSTAPRCSAASLATRTSFNTRNATTFRISFTCLAARAKRTPNPSKWIWASTLRSYRKGICISWPRCSPIDVKGVTVISHPLVQHNLTRLRDKRTRPQEFRRVLSEMAALMLHEATRSFALKPMTVQPPLETARGYYLQREVVLVPILRAGLGMLD